MLTRLFPRRTRPQTRPDLPDDQIALGALLVRIALADREYKQSEVAAIDRILAANFGLGPIEAAKLRATCTDLEMHAVDPDEFTRILREEVEYDKRKAFVHAMWQVVLADGERDDLEESTLHEIEAAMGLSAADSAAARTSALGVPR